MEREPDGSARAAGEEARPILWGRCDEEHRGDVEEARGIPHHAQEGILMLSEWTCCGDS